MTFFDVCSKLNPTKDSYIKYIIKKLILHYSSIIKTDADIFFEKNTIIDFNYDDFLHTLNKILNKNIPVEYITKSFEFYGLDFYINKGVLVPRQETEFIVDWMFKKSLFKNVTHIYDLCTGSGVIANTISYYLKNENKKIFGIEKYNKPFKVSIENKKKLNTDVTFIKADIFNTNKIDYKKANLIICNPPYIDFNDKMIDISTKNEPKTALFAKEKGYYFYFEFIRKIWNILENKTIIVFEIGYNQKEELEKFIKENIKDISKYEFVKDLDRNYRILYMEK